MSTMAWHRWMDGWGLFLLSEHVFSKRWEMTSCLLSCNEKRQVTTPSSFEKDTYVEPVVKNDHWNDPPGMERPCLWKWQTFRHDTSTLFLHSYRCCLVVKSGRRLRAGYSLSEKWPWNDLGTNPGWDDHRPCESWKPQKHSTWYLLSLPPSPRFGVVYCAVTSIAIATAAAWL